MIPLLEYFGGIASGKIVACEKMRLTANKILHDYYNPGKYHFDEKKANKPIEFIEALCKQPSGKIGAPLKLELFQKARLQAIFGFVDDDGIRKYNEVFIIEGRKNGKTSETAAIELYMLTADGEGKGVYQREMKDFGNKIDKHRNTCAALRGDHSGEEGSRAEADRPVIVFTWTYEGVRGSDPRERR